MVAGYLLSRCSHWENPQPVDPACYASAGRVAAAARVGGAATHPGESGDVSLAGFVSVFFDAGLCPVGMDSLLCSLGIAYHWWRRRQDTDGHSGVVSDESLSALPIGGRTDSQHAVAHIEDTQEASRARV